VQLPNLDDLSLSGSIVTVDRETLAGIGTALRGRFGGRSRLLKRHADNRVVNMLLEVPTGLNFTEVEIRGTHECLLSTVRLAEACCKTLVKLSYTVSAFCECHPFDWSVGSGTLALTPPSNVDGCEAFERSFDFSKFPNLQEVEFGIRWMSASLPWIPIAISTLRPATSPRLSALKFDFARRPLVANRRSLDALIEATGDDLRWVADEVARIEREFEGAVDSIILRDPAFQVVFDTLDVRFHSCGAHDTHGLVDSIPCRFFNIEAVRRDLWMLLPLVSFNLAVFCDGGFRLCVLVIGSPGR